MAVLVGALVSLASIPMAAIVLATAIVPVHLPNGFSSKKLQAMTDAGARFGQPGYEADLLYLDGLLSLVIGRSGRLSVDNLAQALSFRKSAANEIAGRRMTGGAYPYVFAPP